MLSLQIKAAAASKTEASALKRGLGGRETSGLGTAGMGRYSGIRGSEVQGHPQLRGEVQPVPDKGDDGEPRSLRLRTPSVS